MNSIFFLLLSDAVDYILSEKKIIIMQKETLTYTFN